MARHPEHGTIVDSIYAAAIVPDKWPETLDLLRRLCDAESAAINQQHVADGTGTRIAIGYELDRQPRYFEGFAARNPLFKGLLREQVGVPHPHQSLVDDAMFKRGPYFNEYCRPNSLYYMAGLVIARTNETAAWLTVNRGPAGAAFDRDQLAGLGRLAAHLRRADEAARQLAEARTARTAWEAALDAMRFGVVLLDQRGRVVFANQAARRLDAAREGFSLRREGVSAAGAPDALARAIDCAASGDGAGIRAGTHLALPRRTTPLPLSALVLPLPRDSDWPAYGTPAVLLLLTNPADVAGPDPAWFVNMFGLTRREAELAALLTAGRRLDDAAALLDIGRETARTHLAHILAKTGTERQADLVRLAAAAASPARRDRGL